MNENIDLTKILKNCPKGWKFYSSVYGDVEFNNLNIYYAYPIVIKINEAKKSRAKKQKTNLKAVQKILNNENDRDKELDKLMKKAKEVINE